MGGFLHEPRDVERIAELMERLASNPVLRARLADAARTRALDKFSSKRLSEAMRESCPFAVKETGYHRVERVARSHRAGYGGWTAKVVPPI